MKVLLDTSVCIALLRKHAKAGTRLLSFAPGECAISSVVAYELFVGVAKSQHAQGERSKVEFLLKFLTIVVFDEAAARAAAQLRADLESIGKPCGAYDLLIAGHALALNLPLATNNVREFSRVSGLQVQDWLA